MYKIKTHLFVFILSLLLVIGLTMLLCLMPLTPALQLLLGFIDATCAICLSLCPAAIAKKLGWEE
ncbi:hypothetical protein AALA22_05705 [Anaerovoracaceae bacterium 41-7]|uniref:Uncharacterized protein n=1 Tax=Anaerotruncus colihominis TaxID=169435 RepID=A0A845QL22_9FIRM|nr:MULTISPECIES: hypothetical protein [Clostridia]MCI9476929.1 hypothetical protein [Emergencia sp.]MCI9639119.1 hypothetical protein [Emergencia sp.]NBH62326.1 hypothetical protein [Anaerotruncus colihominis]NCE99482.1 hypothetical protein [Emergencia sp. 1XD21-10]NCF02981.1 hypothetical protein [Anaerotruncus sp. 80]